MAVVFLILLVIALVSVSSFATVHNEIEDDSIYSDRHLESCILYASFDEDDELLYLSCGHCRYAIWAEAIVVITAGLMCGVSVTSAIIGINM